LDPLVRGLEDGEVRDQVREYFVELGSPAVPDLAAYLKPADQDLRLRIVRMLGDMHKPDAIPYLEPYMKDQNVQVAQEATDAIRKLRKMQDATSMTAEARPAAKS
jgi:HEAT repeat protein